MEGFVRRVILDIRFMTSWTRHAVLGVLTYIERLNDDKIAGDNIVLTSLTAA